MSLDFYQQKPWFNSDKSIHVSDIYKIATIECFILEIRTRLKQAP